ncbi:hypothetical protein SprV_0100024900 [Sparganum proliferum]
MQDSREQKRALQVLIDGVEKWYAEWRKLRPRSVGPLYHLTELNLARTGLKVLPSSGILGALPRLQVLNLQDNCINSLNGALWRCEQLVELRLDRNQLHSVRGEFRNIHCLKVDYRHKALLLLNDREYYKVSDAAILKSLVAKVNRILARLKKDKVITVKDWYMAKPAETAMARFYGLPKVHKPDVPLRPIVSLRGTPTYGLALWLFQRLRFLTADSQTTVHSAEQFLDKIRAVTIEPNERMVSFDVVSLFTSIPRALAVATLSDLLRQNYDGSDGQPTAQDLIELMGHCLKTFFTFEGTTYEQIKGTPMGSPISGLIAEAVLQKLERRLFEEYKPKFWARYVDDTFVIIDHDKINYYAEVLNSIIPDLQFTMEEEVGDKLPFLDVLVCRQPNGELATSVYRKPTNTLQMLSYNSNHPLQHKRSCVRTLY